MKLKSLLKSASLGAGAIILLAGIALAQTTPTPAPAAPAPQAAPKEAPTVPDAGGRWSREDRRAMRDECRSRIGSDLTRVQRREKMRECMRDARGGGQGQGMMRGAQREKMQAARKECFDKLKDQRFTVDERRGEMHKCMLEKMPELAKQMTCRKEAENKKLERGTREFRQFMRQCITAP
ncbi:MAG TPA: hypothetical protein PKW21_01555 [Rhabdaerophilum sp.]|nr:hypothetical protein [Rhabdaerophilum sp.]